MSRPRLQARASLGRAGGQPRMSTDRGHTRGRRALALVAGLAVVAALAGMAACGGDDEPSTSPTTSSDQATTTPSTTAPLSPEEEAKAVYLEFVEVVYANLTGGPNPDDPSLRTVATDPVLGELTDSLTTMQSENHLVERGSQTRQEILDTVVEGDSATIKVYSVGNDRTVDQDDGSVVDEGSSARLAEALLLRGDGGGWRVSDLTTTEIFDGQLQCPR